MPTVAEQLRCARETQTLDIYQVAEITKIKTDHIRALESGNYDAFIAPVYIRGFVRTYAKALKLDLTRIMDDLEVELSQTEKFCEPPPLTTPHQGVVDFVMLRLTKLNWRVVVVVGIVGVVLWLAVAWWRHRPSHPSDQLQHLGPGLYQPRQPQGGETLPLPPPPAP